MCDRFRRQQLLRDDVRRPLWTADAECFRGYQAHAGVGPKSDFDKTIKAYREIDLAAGAVHVGIYFAQ